MLIFAFCTFGLIFALIKFGFNQAKSNYYDKQYNTMYEEYKNFKARIMATKDEIEKARDISNLDDVLDDLSYILNQECKEYGSYYNISPGSKFLKTSFTIRDMVECIRLAKIGKANTDNIMYTSGVMTGLTGDYHDEVYRYYEVWANKFVESGIDMYVYESNPYGTSITTINLSKFIIGK